MQHTKWGILLLALYMMSANLFSQSVSIKSATESDVTLSVNPKKNTNCILVVRETSIKSISPNPNGKYTADPHYGSTNKQSQSGIGNYIVYNNTKAQELTIKDLKNGVLYIGDLYSDIKKSKILKPVKSITFGLLAPEPKTQARIQAFTGMKTNELTILFKWGDGKSRIVLLSEETECELPKDGTIYAASNVFGRGSLTAKSTYVVLIDSGVAKSVTVKGLKPGTRYYAAICEANGSGVHVNYNTDIPKQGSTYTLVEAPVALEAADISETSFLAKWKGSDNSEKYLLEVALDDKFTKPVEEYKSVDVGKIESILIEDLPKSDNFYYRLQAIGPNGRESMYSNVIKVTPKNK